MKSAAVNVGNVNMRGKRTMPLSCGCCDALDLRDAERKRQDEREMREATHLGTSGKSKSRI